MPNDTEALGRHRIFTVGTLAFDEATRTLTDAGQTIAIQRRPLDVLQVLLDRAPAVVTPAEILDTVWRGRIVEESSLTTAIRSLRAALGPEHRRLIENVHGYGYRIPATPLIAFATYEEAAPLSLRGGERAPGHGAWRLVRPLGEAMPQDVWLARHDKSGSERVFKYAGNAARLDALKREAALSRVLRQTLGERPEFVPVLAWHLAEPPFFIEQAYGGVALDDWAAAQGGLGAMALPLRLDLFAQIARAIAAAHGAGVLHGDIKPGNVLVSAVAPPSIRLIDFGAGALTEAASRAALTQSVHMAADAPAGPRTRTWPYAAPEVLRGARPSVKADIYALGILLFQLVVGDFAQPLSAGWEALVADPDLRDAISSAAAGDPAGRPDAAARLADVVTRLDALRVERAARDVAGRAAAALAAKLRRAEIRRPWLGLAVACLVVGATSSTVLAIRAGRDKDEARHQAHLAQGVNAFLTGDLLSRSDPRVSGQADETLTEAALRAEASIPARFARDPEVAGAIYAALARALDARLDYAHALDAYDHAADDYRAFEGPDSPQAAILHLKGADLETFFRTPDALTKARAIVAEVEKRLHRMASRQAEVNVALQEAKGAIAIAAGDGPAALTAFQTARRLADAMPDAFDLRERLRLRFREAQALVDSYRYPEAAKELSDIVTIERALHGPRADDTLSTQLELAEALGLQGEAERTVILINEILPAMIDVLGRSHGNTLWALDLRAGALMDLGRYPEATRDYQALYEAAIQSRGVNPQFVLNGLTGVGQTKCRSGKTAAGQGFLARASKEAVDAYGARSPQASAVAAIQVGCLIEAGEFGAARQALSVVDRDAANSQLPDVYEDETFDLFDAAISHGLGDDAAARTPLVKLVNHSATTTGNLYYRHWAAKLCVEVVVSGEPK